MVNIRLVSDHETGMPRGYAFVEYEDATTALSAIRNLNGLECNGRPVRAWMLHEIAANDTCFVGLFSPIIPVHPPTFRIGILCRAIIYKNHRSHLDRFPRSQRNSYQ